MKPYKRIFTIVIDSLGVGAMPNAAEYDDEGCDTLGHIDASMPKFHIPNLAKLGLANLHPLKHVAPAAEPLGYYTKLLEASVGKDTMTGHWEMMGLHITTPFKTFTETGFPQDLIDELEKRTGRHIIGNKSASGTEILDELAEQEIQNGDLIVYTSADSVLQICGNEETMGVETLYHYCEIARELTMRPEWMVGRVIARPYTGSKKGEFKRTSNRHDYALKPYGKTALDALKEAGLDVISIGKIKDIFDGEGITQAHKSKSFDELLGVVLNKLQEDDLLIITADHGNDPTYKGTDHTKEMVPFLAYSPRMEGHGLLPVSDTFAMIGATIADNFEVSMPKNTIGTSCLKQLK